MPHYLLQGGYGADAWAGLTRPKALPAGRKSRGEPGH
jgi:hypothetical protein